MSGTVLPILLMASMAVVSYAHGDLHERIEKLSDQIETYPDSALLYLKRGELFNQHQEHGNAIEDFNKCQSLGFTSIRLKFGLARAFEAIGQPQSAINFLDQILMEENCNVKAWRRKGKILFNISQYPEAGECFNQVIAYANHTFTENFLEAARAWSHCGTAEAYRKALSILHSGIQTLGGLILFYEELIELHLGLNELQNALYYQTIVIEKSNRKENAFYNRALLHMKNKDYLAATRDLQNAIQMIEKLPYRIRQNNATQQLRSKINQQLATYSQSGKFSNYNN